MSYSVLKEVSVAGIEPLSGQTKSSVLSIIPSVLRWKQVEPNLVLLYLLPKRRNLNIYA